MSLGRMLLLVFAAPLVALLATMALVKLGLLTV